MLKRYNDENFSDVIKSLKELPKITAPKDFEIDLKLKLNTVEPVAIPARIKYHNYSRIFVPAFGMAVIVLLMFLIVFNQNSSDPENPFLKPPALRSASNTKGSSTLKISEFDVVLDEQQAKNKMVALTPLQNQVSSTQLKGQDRRNRFIDLISATGDENNVDKSLRARPGNGINNGNGETVGFNGFNIIQDEDQSMDRLRARMDSLKKYTKERK